ncbi:MAG: DNA repair protein [Deltaproteobacteria bacterium]|nr:DNA repair protein [Deltaproteobacteria bacterium]
MRKATLRFGDINLRASHIHKFRGFVGNLFKDYDLIHNHDLNTGKLIYRYPLIQFKLIDNIPCIVAITGPAVAVFLEIFMTMENVVIDDVKIPIFEKDLKVDNVEFGFSNDTLMYKFVSPWIGLNQKNYQRYRSSSLLVKNEILKKTLVGNMLSMAKHLDCWLDKRQRISVELQVKEKNITLKSKSMLGFTGIFKANFIIPDDFGIGKSVSRGFGAVRRSI